VREIGRRRASAVDTRAWPTSNGSPGASRLRGEQHLGVERRTRAAASGFRTLPVASKPSYRDEFRNEELTVGEYRAASADTW
jgi:hypothetical protein